MEHTGGLDLRGRPMTRIRVVGCDDELLCLVDTGYNGQLWMSEELARQFKLTPSSFKTKAEVASNEEQEVRLWTGEIEWLGQTIAVEAHVLPKEAPARGNRSANAEPYALLGTALLQQSTLYVDFPAGETLIA